MPNEDCRQELPVEQAQRFANAEVNDCVPELGLTDHADAHDQLFIDAQDKGHGAARDTRHNIGAAHGKTTGRQAGILG